MSTSNSIAENQLAESRKKTQARESHAPSGLAVIATVFQAVMLAAHWLIYETWSFFWGPMDTGAQRAFALGMAILSFSFLGATLLAFRHNNFIVRAFYRVAAVWLGVLNFLFLAVVASWLAYGFVLAIQIAIPGRWIATVFFGAALLVGAWGVINANWVRVRKMSVRLENLPDAWRGRAAVLASDLHLGHVRHRPFSARIARKIAALKPDIVLLAGDLFDGTVVNAAEVVKPWEKVTPPFGVYFVTGNHELFRGDSQFVDAVRGVGIRVLENEKVRADGLQIVGVPYNHATHAEHFRSVLAKLAIDPGRASILLTHAPDRPEITEEAGIGLQLSGHTHFGQFFPFTWITTRIYRQFTYGLSRLGKSQFYVSSGAGSWGPPLRVGSQAEIVLISFL